MAQSDYFLLFDKKSSTYFVVNESDLIEKCGDTCKFKYKRNKLNCLVVYSGNYIVDIKHMIH